MMTKRVNDGWLRCWVLCAMVLGTAMMSMACGGGGGGGGGGGPVTLSGDWEITRTPDVTSLDSSFACNMHNVVTQVYDVARNGNDVTMTNTEGDTLTGTMTGNRCVITGHFVEGDEEVFINGEFTFTSNTELSGFGTFRWEDGVDYCQWEEDYTGTRMTNGNCIFVDQGGWEFVMRYSGHDILTFTGGNLVQSGCNASYDRDNVFSGPINGNRWSGSNAREGIEFSGTFSGGNPATVFRGTWSAMDGSGYSGELYGVRGTLR